MLSYSKMNYTILIYRFEILQKRVWRMVFYQNSQLKSVLLNHTDKSALMILPQATIHIILHNGKVWNSGKPL